MNKKRAKEIIGDATQDELRQILKELNSKEFLYLESDIERKQAVKVLLKIEEKSGPDVTN